MANHDPLPALLVLAGGAIVCMVFIPHWSAISVRIWRRLTSVARHTERRVFAWAAEQECACHHCVKVRQILADTEWQQFLGTHQELQPRKKAAS